jgi:hypothetical protein
VAERFDMVEGMVVTRAQTGSRELASFTRLPTLACVLLALECVASQSEVVGSWRAMNVDEWCCCG